jgi:ABC-2 type transport system ATP-binding protein
MLVGLLKPSAGSATIAGHDIQRAPQEAKRQIGFIPDRPFLYEKLSGREFLRFVADLHGLEARAARTRGEDFLELFELKNWGDELIESYSHGMRQKLVMCAALLHQPRVLIVDEPMVGLDPKQIIAIRELIRELGRERTLLLSTHILPEVELLCHRVMIIDRGRIVVEGTPENLRESWVGNPGLRVTIKGAPAEAVEVLEQIEGVVAVLNLGEGLAVEHKAGTDVREEVFRAAVERGWVLLELARERATLEDVFVRLTTHDTAAVESPEEVTA